MAIKHRLFNMIIVACIALPMVLPACVFATTITAIMSSDQPRYHEAHRAFVKALATHDYKPPTTKIILRPSGSDPLSFMAETRKLNSSKPDLIVTYGAPASLAVVREASGIPIISVDVFTPEQPLKGVCGVSSRVSMAALLKALLDIRPYQRIGVLYTAREFGSQQQLEDIRKFSVKLGITVTEANIASAQTLDAELGKLLDKCEAVVVTEGSIFGQQFDRIVNLAKAKKIPLAATMPDAAKKGAVVSLEVNPQEQGYLAAEMAVRVLEGAKTEFLPLVRPQRIDLVFNMRLAREIGIEVPFSALRGATRLIK